MKKIIITLPAAAIIGIGLVQMPEADTLSMFRSCGYHCHPGGSKATPAAPPESPEIQPAGRTDIRSGGRPRNTPQPRTGPSPVPRVTKGVRKL